MPKPPHAPHVPAGAVPLYLSRRPETIIGLSAGVRIGLAVWDASGRIAAWSLPDFRIEGTPCAHRVANALVAAVAACEHRPASIVLERPTQAISKPWRSVIAAGQEGARLAAKRLGLPLREITRQTILAAIGLPATGGGDLIREALRRSGFGRPLCFGHHAALALAAAWIAGLTSIAPRRPGRKPFGAKTGQAESRGAGKPLTAPSKRRPVRKPAPVAPSAPADDEARLAAMRVRIARQNRGGVA